MPIPRFRRLRFSLRFLLLAVVLLSCWLAVTANRVHRKRLAVDTLRRLDATFWYDYQRSASHDEDVFFGETRTGATFIGYGALDPRNECPGTRWIRRVIGDDFFRELYSVDLSRKSVSTEDLRSVNAVGTLAILNLTRSQVTDEALKMVADHRTLRVLILDGTGVSDAGLKHIRGLSQLRSLSLNDCWQVTDAAVDDLNALTELRALQTTGTRISDAALTRLDQLPNLGFLNGRVLE